MKNPTSSTRVMLLFVVALLLMFLAGRARATTPPLSVEYQGVSVTRTWDEPIFTPAPVVKRDPQSQPAPAPFSYQATFDFRGGKPLALGTYRIGSFPEIPELSVLGFVGVQSAANTAFAAGGALAYSKAWKSLVFTGGLGYAAFSSGPPHPVILLGISGFIQG